MLRFGSMRNWSRRFDMVRLYERDEGGGDLGMFSR
jgi:hypothetical protein